MTYEYTFAMIKSAAVLRKQSLAILQSASLVGLEVVHFRHHLMTVEEAELLYPEHVSRPYWGELLGSVRGHEGVVIAVLRGPFAVSRWRSLLGPTNALKALPGTIRHTYGRDAKADNAAHGSATILDAVRELQLFFPQEMNHIDMLMDTREHVAA